MKITGGVFGTKAVSISDIDRVMDLLISGVGLTEAQDLYKAVAWTFGAVNLRANNVSQIPFNVYPLSVPISKEDDENKIDFEMDITRMLWQVEAWLQLKGAAYVLKRRNQVIIKELQVLNANTMKVLTFDEGTGEPLVFRQQIGSRHKDYPASEIVYFRTWSPSRDVHEGVASGEVGSTASKLIHHGNVWAASFFENGAIPAVFLTTESAVPKGEKQRIEGRWNRWLAGVRKFRTVVLERGLVPTIVGQPVKDLALPELESTRRSQIWIAHGIPPGLADTKTNRAERDALQYEFWDQWIIPWTRANIAPILNDQLFKEQGLRLSFQYNLIEAMQREEIKKGEAMAFVVSGVAVPLYEANLISIEESRTIANTVIVAVGIPPLDESFTPEVREIAIAPANENTGPGAGVQPGESAGETTRPKASAPGWGRHRVSSQN